MAIAVGLTGPAAWATDSPVGSHSAKPQTRCAARREKLPDLVQEVPSEVSVNLDRSPSGRITFLLGFTTATANEGAGPMKIIGRRTAGQSEMRAVQLVSRRSGGSCRYRNVGRVRFDFNQSHDHWHLLGFDRYSLTALDGSHPVAPVRKAGFCLNDDERAPRPVRGMPSQRVFMSDCDLGQPQALSVTEGISPGWSDVYLSNVEGQAIDITRVPAGRYMLANQVNPRRLLHESDYANDAASLLIRLSWPHGRQQSPAVRILRACRHSAVCRPRRAGR